MRQYRTWAINCLRLQLAQGDQHGALDGWVRHVLDLGPVARAPRPVGLVSALGDDALKAELACVQEHPIRYCPDFPENMRSRPRWVLASEWEASLRQQWDTRYENPVDIQRCPMKRVADGASVQLFDFAMLCHCLSKPQ
jgi:hypothetical protein